MILLLVAFVLLLVWVTLANANVKIAIPATNLELNEKLVHEMSNTSIPDFVLTYGTKTHSLGKCILTTNSYVAPLVFLEKADAYYPSDLAEHISKTHPTFNFTAIIGVPEPLNLDNLDKLNDLTEKEVYLTSTESIFKLPSFLHGKRPSSHTLQTHKATSCVVIVVEKGDGILDAFYMYFYTFNEGPTALGHVVGNHLGDW